MNTTASEDAIIMANLTDQERASLVDEAEANPPAEPEQMEYRQEANIPLKADIPQNASEILTQITAYKDSLAQQFDDGEITGREFREAMDRVAVEREKIEWAFKKADLAREMAATIENENWSREVTDFMTTGPGAAIAKSHSQMVAFDNVVKYVTADPANANLSDRAQLQKAWRLYKDDSSRAGISNDAYQTSEALGRMGAGVSHGADNFSTLDSLANTDPMAFEAAVARMTPKERDAYGFG